MEAWFCVEGADDPPNPGQLAAATKLPLGTQYSERDFDQAVENLVTVLKNNGLYQAKIFPEVTAKPEVQEVDFTFLIDPGDRAKYNEPIITGDPLKSKDRIVRATAWRRFWGLLGFKKVTESRTQRALERIRTMYRKENRLTARVTLANTDHDATANRVTHTLNIVAGPEIVIKAEGAKVSRGKLRELVPVYQEQTVDKDLLMEGARNLIEHMQTQGYFDAEVDFETSTEKESQVITYKIARGQRHKLVHVEITGNKYFDEQTIRERMFIREATLLQFRRGRFSQDYLQRDLDTITALYHGNGFRNVEVTAKVEEGYDGEPNDIGVRIQIDEGPQSFVSDLELVGVNLRDYEFIQTLLHSSVGQPFSDLNVAADRDGILNYYYNNGFPEATFEFTSTPGPQPNTHALKFTITEGPRRFVRRVLVGGLNTTNRDLVEQRIKLEQGDPLSQASMTESQRGLYDLGIFAKVDTAIQNPEGRERNKYVLYEMEEARRYSLNIGFGAEIARLGGGGDTNLTSPGGAAGFSPRLSFGISRSNFLGQAHTITLNTRVSNIQRRGLITYLAPQFKGTPDLNLSFSGLFDDSRDVRTFSARRMEGAVQLGQRLSKASTLQYRFSYRRVSVDENTVKITPELIPLLSQPVRVGMIGASYIQDRRDDPVDPRRGIYNTLDIGYASKIFGSQAAFTRAIVRNATYHRLTRQVVFARQIQFGWIHSFTTPRDPQTGSTTCPDPEAPPLPEGRELPCIDIPLPERIFSGGATSHRGFSESQAGPRDLYTGFPVGGKAILTNILELRFPLVGENLGGVLFHDMGNVFSGLSDISFRFTQRDQRDFNYIVHAVGLGIRYRTPVGPVRFDLAFAPNTPRFRGFQGTREELLAGTGQITDQRIRRIQFHFSLGHTF
jgi:outer membrane protein assembly complex protein YaeT